MAWLSQWKLGRPGKEQTFDTNASVLEWVPRRVADFRRGLDGSGIDLTSSRNRPTFHMSGNFVTPAMRKTLESLIMIDDTPMIFRPFDLNGALMWESIQEWVYPMSLTQVKLPPNSYLRAAEVLAAAGAPTQMLPIGVWTTFLPDSEVGSGFNYLNQIVYSQNFETLVLGDLSGQDSWINLNAPTPNCLVLVENSDVITGTQSAWARTTGVMTTGPLYRRTLSSSLASDWQFTANMKNAASNPSSIFYIGGWSNDVFGTPQWVIRMQRLGTGSVVLYFHLSNIVVPVASMASDSLLHAHDVSVSGGLITWSVDGVQKYTGAYAGTYDRLMMSAADSTSGPFPNPIGVVDDIVVSKLMGSYDPATRILTLGTSLPLIAPAYVTYKSSAAAVRAALIPFTNQGGWLDTSKYDLDGEGM